MRSLIFAIAGIAAVASLLFMLTQTASVHADAESISDPDGYRTWTFLHRSIVPAGAAGYPKSPCLRPCSNGIVHFYANEQAMIPLLLGAAAPGETSDDTLQRLHIAIG